MKKYITIANDIEHKMNNGMFVTGEKLPSVRNTAKQYHCSVNTVVRAYEELEKRHMVYSIPQSGYYVVEKQATPPNKSDRTTIDFASALPDPCVFPYVDFQHCLNKAVDTYRWELFNALDAKGMDELRHTLVSHLAADQVFAKKEQIIISPGIQHMLEFLAKLPFPNGKSTILVEQPSFDMYLRFLEAEGIPVCGVARTSEGIDLQKLEEKFKSGGIKFFYTMPRHHNPLGIEYSTEEKKKIAQLATKYDVYIVEDDYMVDVGESKFDSIYYYNETAHVIYIKSFSKIIFPGLKVGAAVFPENMLKIYSKYQSHSITSPLPQAALQLYIKNGMYERHKQKIIDQYAARIRALNEAIRRYNDDNLITIPDVQSGIFVPFQLPQTVNLERLVERLKAKQIMVVPGKQFYLTNYKNRAKFLRVSVSRALVEQMDTGVREIIEEVRREVKSPI